MEHHKRRWSVIYRTKETSVVVESGVKSNSIPPATYLQRSTTSKQPLLMVHDRSSLPLSLVTCRGRVQYSS